MNVVAVVPGSFDPITNGHLDVVTRASQQLDEVVVAVLENPRKSASSMFTVDERLELIGEVVAPLGNVRVDRFSGLLVDYCTAHDISLIVKGLRAVSDFEYELQMAQMNQELWPEIETLFLVPEARYSFISSSLVREVASLGGDVSSFVSPHVLERLDRKLGR